MRLFLLINCALLVSCGQPQFEDASLKIDVNTLSTTCDCNDALISLMEEAITILKEMKPDLAVEDKNYLNAEYTKRLEKQEDVHMHCSELYQEANGLGDCDNLEKGEALNEELNKLQEKNGL